MEPVVVRLIFYDYAGNIQKIHETKLQGRYSFLTGFNYSQFPDNDFQGYMEMEATLPISINQCFPIGKYFISLTKTDFDDKVCNYIFRMGQRIP